jgi:hypothetical protein
LFMPRVGGRHRGVGRAKVERRVGRRRWKGGIRNGDAGRGAYEGC